MTALDGKALLDHGKAIARRYAGRIGADDADDLRAEAMLHALRSPPPDGRMQPWLERIYRNLLVDRWRRAGAASGQTLEGNAAVDPITTETPEHALLQGERRRLVRRCLRELPRDARRAVLFRYYVEGEDVCAADTLGVTSTTIRTRIHRALARMRRRLNVLRGWYPPLVVKLGTQIAALGMTPALVTVLVLSSALPSEQQVSEAALATLGSTHPRRELGGFVTPPPRMSIPKMFAPTKTLLVRHRPPHSAADPSTDPGLRSAAPLMERLEGELVVGEIRYPDAVELFAEPSRSEVPSLVEIPLSFTWRIGQSIEDAL
jgi:RNA polymerase sigma factor (sigma-70 family)